MKCKHCGEDLERWQITSHVCKPKDMVWYLIGVFPERNPDPDYWYARFEYVPAVSEQEAREKWIELREGWLCNEEKRFIKCYNIIRVDVKNPQKKPSVWTWQKKQQEIKQGLRKPNCSDLPPNVCIKYHECKGCPASWNLTNRKPVGKPTK